MTDAREVAGKLTKAHEVVSLSDIEPIILMSMHKEFVRRYHIERGQNHDQG